MLPKAIAISADHVVNSLTMYTLTCQVVMKLHVDVCTVLYLMASCGHTTKTTTELQSNEAQVGPESVSSIKSHYLYSQRL